ncbi:hypothetical protein KKF61_04510 [Patescibacteria group bacterium]|nr:hypothetical protein [Patescibacteria group bacterium]
MNLETHNHQEIEPEIATIEEKEQESLGEFCEKARNIFFHDLRDDYIAEGQWDDLSEDEKEKLDREAESQFQFLRDLAGQYGEKFIDITIENIKKATSNTQIYPAQLELEERFLRFLAREKNIPLNENLLNPLRNKIYMNGVKTNIQRLQEMLQSGHYYSNEAHRLVEDIKSFIEKGALDLSEKTKLELTQLGITTFNKN